MEIIASQGENMAKKELKQIIRPQVKVSVSEFGTPYVTKEDFRKFCEHPVIMAELTSLRDAGLIELGFDVFGTETITHVCSKCRMRVD